jgi:hypothetical protein
MHALELGVACVPRGNAILEQAGRTEPARGVRDAVRRFGMIRAPKVLGVKFVVDDDHRPDA